MKQFGVLVALLWCGAIAERPQPQRLELIPRTEFMQRPALRQIIDTAAIDYALIEAALFHFTNKARAQRGKEELQFQPDLAKAAKLHSQSMYKMNYFSHQNKYKRALRNSGDRVLAQNDKFMAVGENLAQSSLHNLKDGQRFYYNNEHQPMLKNGEPIGFLTYGAFAKRTVQMWLKSKHHRANMMSSYKYMACGVSQIKINPKGLSEIYITQNFGNL